VRTHLREDECRTFVRAYPIRDGTANTTWCSSRSDGARLCLGKSANQDFNALARRQIQAGVELKGSSVTFPK